MSKMPEFAVLKIGDKEVKLPLVQGTEGDYAIDIARLRTETGMVTLDPSFMNTASCYSTITYIDGDNGILRETGVFYQSRLSSGER